MSQPQSEHLNLWADIVEEILRDAGIPGRVAGGSVHPGGSIEFDVLWDCYPLRFKPCSAVRAQVRKVFECDGGIDGMTMHFWLLRGGGQRVADVLIVP